ncbi:hypothetical protein ACFSCX_03685 [Bacillus salitolerans]|uniref:Uncharacterized protein n=1 Tax=Bacillus salitolerans TaxID=1437434 RepID=A0ABW4LNN2_9BACI
MKQLVNTNKRTDVEKRIPVLRLEVDYELATLYEALMSKDDQAIRECKRKLEKLRSELMKLEA